MQLKHIGAFPLAFKLLGTNPLTRAPSNLPMSNTPPLPDTGQWLLLSLNEKLPHTLVEIMKAHIIRLHHFLMLFMMLAFSVLFDSVKAPGLGLGARYMFTTAIGRHLWAITFLSTILSSARLWCVSARYTIPAYPHRWAQKYYIPCASDATSIRQLIHLDMAYMEAYGGFSSAIIWLLVMHSAEREIRECHHYSADCVVAIYIGILLWKMTGFIWPMMNTSRDRRLDKLEKIHSRFIQAAKDSDMDEVREHLEEGETKRSRIAVIARLCGCFPVPPFSPPSPLFSLHLHGRTMGDLSFWYEFF